MIRCACQAHGLCYILIVSQCVKVNPLSCANVLIIMYGGDREGQGPPPLPHYVTGHYAAGAGVVCQGHRLCVAYHVYTSVCQG